MFNLAFFFLLFFHLFLFLDPPSPLKLPIIGHLYLFAKYDNDPWKCFDDITHSYGNVVSLQLGQFKAVLLSSLDSIKEVLLDKADVFVHRPPFQRYDLIFGGDRDNCKLLERYSSKKIIDFYLYLLSICLYYSSCNM